MARTPKTFGDYNIYTGEKPHTDLLAILREQGDLPKGAVTFSSFPDSPEEEAAAIAEQDIKESTNFERNRAHVREALKAIVGFALTEFDLPRKGGVDFGSGATGEMVERLLTPYIDKSSWAQVEVNPESVAENKRRHPHSVIMEGSYLNTESLGLTGRLNIATGLSSLDATHFMTQAVEQIGQTLTKGGYLLHVQDVRPGLGVGAREMRRLGMKSPYSVECVPGTNQPLAYEMAEGMVSVGELFRREIGRVLKAEPGFDLILNNWVTASKALKSSETGRFYFLNMHMAPAIPIEEASAVVTIAKKKA